MEVAEKAAESLSGTWVTEEGSSVVFAFSEGLLSGTYSTAVGNATSRHPLVGAYAADPSSPSSFVVGFVVAWKKVKEGKKPSVTSWSGRIDLREGQKPTLVATWLLSRMKPPPWCSTIVGKTTFTKQ